MENRGPKGKRKMGRLIPALNRAIQRESGFALPVALIVLLIITFLGISAITFTNLDVAVSRNVRNTENVFYNADNCLVLARGVLKSSRDIAVGAWSTALAGHSNGADEIVTSTTAGTDLDANTGVLKNTRTANAPGLKRGAILYNDLNVAIKDYAFGNGYCTVWVRNDAVDLKAGKYVIDSNDIVVVTAMGKSSTGAQDTIEAAISWNVLTNTSTSSPWSTIEDYPQLTMGPQNLNAAKTNLDVLP